MSADWFDLLDVKTQRRFWDKVASASADECWDWQRSRTTAGYGQFMIRPGVIQRTHRIAWALVHGRSAEGLVIRHSCDRPVCCNPAHLSDGTQADNVHDAVTRGRASGGRTSRPGEKSPLHRITTSQARAVRRSRAAGATCAAIAERFGISKSQVSRIATGKRWAHLDAPASQGGLL